MKIFFVILSGLALLGSLTPPEGGSQDDHQAGIRLTEVQGMLAIEPWFHNSGADSLELSYSFTQDRIQPNGSRSRGRQGGPFTCAPGDTVVLSRQRVNVDPGASCELDLVIKQGNKTLIRVQEDYQAQ